MTIHYDDPADWAEVCEVWWTQHKSCVWLLADAVNAGLDQFAGPDPKARHALLQDLSEQLGLSPKTLANYARVGAAFPDDARHPDLTIHHHEVVITKDVGERAMWLRLAAEGLWSVERMRVEVRGRAGPSDDPIALPDPIAVERVFYRAGIRATISGRKATFTLQDASLTVEAETELKWSTRN